VTTFADIRTLCEQHQCTPALRGETRDGRVYVSLSATETKTGGKTLYDLRADYAWDDALQAGALLTQASQEWFQ